MVYSCVSGFNDELFFNIFFDVHIKNNQFDVEHKDISGTDHEVSKNFPLNKWSKKRLIETLIIPDTAFEQTSKNHVYLVSFAYGQQILTNGKKI